MKKFGDFSDSFGKNHVVNWEKNFVSFFLSAAITYFLGVGLIYPIYLVILNHINFYLT